jgi:hypothetical protein
VLEQINKIDVASADALKRLREEREVLEGRIRAMDEMKGDVTEQVYLRVRSDYSQRVQQLHDQARPLLDEARKQYAQLRVILDKLQSELDSVNLDRQELELRHKLGEFDAKEFQKQLKGHRGRRRREAAVARAGAAAQGTLPGRRHQRERAGRGAGQARRTRSWTSPTSCRSRPPRRPRLSRRRRRRRRRVASARPW